MQENEIEINADLDLLSSVALEAGELALRYFGKKQQVWMKDGISPVGEADLAVDTFLKEKLLMERPYYGWISEESQDLRSGNFHRFFVVDPIDGTRGFIEKKKSWCISIAVIENGHPIVGVLECSSKKEHFKAQLGKPALLNGQKISVASENFRTIKLISCRKSLLNTILPSFIERVQISVPISSLAYRLALLSKGDLDAVFIPPGCHNWDIAAADVLLKQSGGMIMDRTKHEVFYSQTSYSNDFLLAASEKSIVSILEKSLIKTQ